MSAKCWAAWHSDDDVRKASTSGGAFSALADIILGRGGVVVGAAYDDRLNVRHEFVMQREGLRRLRGVKYVKGSLGREIYDGIREFLRQKRPVLFVGLPCQVAAMRKVFGRAPSLFLCDLVCFGAPPHRLWRKYVDWLEVKRGLRLVNVNPRDKKYGWGRKTYYRYEWADGRVTRRLSLFDPYAQMFYSTIGFSLSCFACQFRGMDRVSDLTLCDMWNAAALDLPEGVMSGGVSGVIVHSEKGEELFSATALERVSVPTEVFVKGNYPILNSAKRPEAWRSFEEDSRMLAFGQLAKKYRLVRTPVAYVVSRACDSLKGGFLRMLPNKLKNAIKGKR